MNVPIIFICDNDNLQALSVALHSLSIQSNSKLDIFVIGDSLKYSSINNIKNTSFKNLNINFYDATDTLSKDLKLLFKKGYVPHTALLKFYIPLILTSYDKALYLDTDIIVKKDLSDLLNVDISNYYVAAIKNIVIPNHNKKDIIHKSGYFNTGVMLMNLNLMRKDNICEKLINTKKVYNKDSYMDQSVFNIVLKNKVKYLPLKYNYLQIYDLNPLIVLNWYFNSNYKDNQELENDIYILHLAGRNKPWKCVLGYSYIDWITLYNKSPLRLTKSLNNIQTDIKTYNKHIKRIRFANIDIFCLNNAPIFAKYNNLLMPIIKLIFSKNSKLGFRHKDNYSLDRVKTIFELKR